MPSWEPLWRRLRSEVPDIAQHSLRVRRYASALALYLRPDDPEFARSVRLAALLHDIGKLTMPREILYKPAALSESEIAIMRQHTTMGLKLIRTHGEHADVLLAIAHHHERWDGDGYPSGLAGEDIPLAARIVAVADSFDAMTTYRPYRPTLQVPEAMTILVAGAGSQWDPDVVAAFLTFVRTCRRTRTQVVKCRAPYRKRSRQ